MNKYIKYFGLDISKDVFDLFDSNHNYYQFKNNISGFKKLIKLLDSYRVYVIEAIGYYNVCLAYFLLENAYKVSVVNPLRLNDIFKWNYQKKRLIKVMLK